ncbi:hypothetical protein D3C80_1600680 [compost metagenome]
MPAFFHCFNKKEVIKTIVWFPFNKIILPSLLRTATPKRSQSGSVPTTISEFVLSAKASAIVKASGSSGFGDLTVGKSPSGTACSGTICTFLYPACDKTSGIDFIEVPCNEVNTMCRLSLASAGVLKLAFSIDDFINALSSSVSMY